MVTKTFDIKPSPKKRVSVSSKVTASPRRRRKKTEDELPDAPSETFIASASAVERIEVKGDTATRDAFLEYVTQSPRKDEPFSVPVKTVSIFSRLFRKAIRIIAVIGICSGLVYAVGTVLARVTIQMTVSSAVQEDIFPIRLVRVTSKQSATTSLVFEETRKVFLYTQSYAATGKGQATGYAKGMITIENRYSSQVMRFVAGTRFSDDKGQVFRTQQAVSIPGYTKDGNTIVPGTVSVEVRADNAGPNNNLAKGTILKVVAFAGTDKYNLMSGVVSQDFGGGAQGETTIVTADDIQNAKQQIVEYAFSNAKEEVLASLPEGTRVLDRALQLKVTKITVKAATGDPAALFDASVDGELRIRFFDERLLRQYLEGMLEQPAIKNDIVQSELQISYENVNTSFENEDMAMQIRVKRVIEPVLDTVGFRRRIAGKTIADLRSELLKLEGLEKVDISVWPFWLSRIPTDIDKIRITLK